MLAINIKVVDNMYLIGCLFGRLSYVKDGTSVKILDC